MKRNLLNIYPRATVGSFNVKHGGLTCMVNETTGEVPQVLPHTPTVRVVISRSISPLTSAIVVLLVNPTYNYP